MFHVICPQCQKRLKVAQEFSNKKFKCNGCGHVFVGSTQPDGASAKPAAPAVPPPPAQRPVVQSPQQTPAAPKPAAPRPAAPKTPARPGTPVAAEGEPVEGGFAGLSGGPVRSRTVPTIRANSKLPFFIVIGCAVLLIPTVIAFWFFSTRTLTYNEVDGTSKYMTQAEREDLKKELDERLKQEAKKKADERAKARAGNAAANTSNTAGSQPASQPVDASGKPILDPNKTIDTKFGAIKTPDPSIVVAPTVHVPDGPGLKFSITGTVTNGTKQPLQELIVTIQLKNAAGTIVDQDTIPIGWIPTGSSAPFYFKPQAPEEKLTATITVDKRDADPDAVMWEICSIVSGKMNDDLAVKTGESNTKIRVTGTIKNPTGMDLKDVKIYVEAFDEKGKDLGDFLGRAEGKILDKTVLPKDGTDSIDIPIDLSKMPLQTGVQKLYIRAVGTKVK